MDHGSKFGMEAGDKRPGVPGLMMSAENDPGIPADRSIGRWRTSCHFVYATVLAR